MKTKSLGAQWAPAPKAPAVRDVFDAVVQRLRPEDLEAVLDDMPRTVEATKQWMREFFVEGLTTNAIAERHGCHLAQISAGIRRVREKLVQSPSAWQFVGVQLIVPLALAQELQSLSNELIGMKSRDDATAALAPVISAVERARRKIAEGTPQ